MKNKRKGWGWGLGMGGGGEVEILGGGEWGESGGDERVG